MPYVGNTPAEKYASFAVQHFTTSATTGYTLDHAVTNENDIRLVINNVVQQPGGSYAYTAAGTVLTLSAATAGTDTMYCVFLGKAVQTVNPGAGSVGTTALADNAVTLGKMASGTDGNIISYDASGNPVAVATGSSGQVLTSAGAGAPPTFAAASGTTINNNADNRVITGSGTANTLEGEANLTYDGSVLTSNALKVLGEVRIQNATTGTGSNDGLLIESSGNNVYFNQKENAPILFRTNNTDRFNISSDGHLLPHANNTYDLGSVSKVWRNIYTADLNMSNEYLDKGNEVDGTKGSWSIQEGEEDLFLLNRKNGKKYKFNLTEVK